MRLTEKLDIKTIIALFSFTVGVLLIKPILHLPLLIPKGLNEGWNAFQAQRALGDASLYPEMTELVANNYPPLSFYIVGALGYLFGDNIIAGRVVALLSFLSVALCIGLLVRRIGGSNNIAIFSSLLFMGAIACRYEDHITLNDPQMLGHALMMAGFVVFLRDPENVRRVVLAVVLMLLSGLVKHNLIPLPIAITIWLFLYHKRSFRVWVRTSALLVVVALVTLYLAYGENFFASVLAAPREYRLGLLVTRLENFVGPLVPLVAFALLYIAIDHTSRNATLLLLYLVLAGCWGVFIMGGWGVTHNAIFDLIISAAIGAGLGVAVVAKRLSGTGLSRSMLEAVGALVLTFTVLVSAPRQLARTARFILDLDQTSRSVAADIAFLKAQDGRVACQDYALCYWAGKPFEMDFFGTGMRLHAGILDEDQFIQRLENGYFSLIQVQTECDNPHVPVLPPRINDYLRSRCVVRRRSITGFYLEPNSPKP